MVYVHFIVNRKAFELEHKLLLQPTPSGAEMAVPINSSFESLLQIRLYAVGYFSVAGFQNYKSG
jgi:hypothetical protein